MHLDFAEDLMMNRNEKDSSVHHSNVVHVQCMRRSGILAHSNVLTRRGTVDR